MRNAFQEINVKLKMYVVKLIVLETVAVTRPQENVTAILAFQAIAVKLKICVIT